MSDTVETDFKAFKAAFGFKADTNDWAKVAITVAKALTQLDDIVVLMDDLGIGDPDRTAARNVYDEMTADFEDAKKEKPIVGGLAMRDHILPRLLDETKFYRKLAKSTPLSVQSNGEAVTVFWTDLPGFDQMSKSEQDKIAAVAAQKIQRGKQVFQDVVSGGRQGPATLQDVTDLTWALKTTAQSKGSPYEKGALTVPGGVELRDFLDSCAGEVYPRISSHLPELAKLEGQSARGIDCYGASPGPGNDGDPDRLLPAGMNTLLYQMVKTPQGEERLYVKMETEGMIGSGGGNKKTDSTAPKARPRRDGDFSNGVKHAKNWVLAEMGKHSQDEDLGAYRENAAKALEKLATGVLNAAPKAITARVKLARGKLKITKKGPKWKDLRVNFFLAQLSEIIDGMDFDPSDPDAWRFRDAVEAFSDKVRDVYGADADLDAIYGGEIVLAAGDMA